MISYLWKWTKIIFDKLIFLRSICWLNFLKKIFIDKEKIKRKSSWTSAKTLWILFRKFNGVAKKWILKASLEIGEYIYKIFKNRKMQHFLT